MFYLLFPTTVLTTVLLFCQPNLVIAQSDTEIIKTETCWSYTIENNVPATSGFITRKIEYDDQGKQTKITTYNENGSIAYEYYFDYTANMRETYWKLSDGTRVNSETELYDDDGKLLERARYDTDGKLKDKLKIAYEKDQKSKEVYFNKLDEIIFAIDYSYNKEQKTIRELYRDYVDDENTIGAIDLDANALPKAYTEYKTSGPLVRSILYQRDESGRVLVKEIYAADNTLQLKEVFEYTKNAKHYSVYVNNGAELVEHVIYKYDYYQSK